MIYPTSAKRFVRSTRAGATAIAAAAVTVMSVGGVALITDHLWLVDQRDTLKSAADSSSIAATHAMNRMLEADSTLSDAVLKDNLEGVARRYIELNLSHFSAARLARAKETLAIEVTIDRAASRVEVAAEADLGGTLFARVLPLLGGYTGPEAMQASAAIECGSTAIEVVLALDVTASMHGRIDRNLPARGDNRRLNAVIKAAKALVVELHATCEGRSIAGGVVPWDKTVRVPNPATWQENSNTWVKMGPNRTGTIPADWAGCVEDRAHDANPLNATALASATSMSLALPASSPFPPFIYPDTRDFPVAPMADSIKGDFPALPASVKDVLVTRLEALRDNDWGRQGRRGRGGGNYHCTSTKMLPLTTNLDTVKSTLDGIKTSEVMGGGTMAHLGVTWGRRMLAHSWRTVWGDSVHPIDPADREVSKVLILLTDGGNALEDNHSQLPGRLDAIHVGVPDCLGSGTRPSSCRQGDLGTFYSALGRLGPGDKAQGHYYPGWGVRGTTGGGSRTSETALSALMKRSCALAHGEGLTVYTIGAMPSVRTRWREALVACSGAPETTDADRAEFFFHAADGPALDHAFRAIARRVITLRRVS